MFNSTYKEYLSKLPKDWEKVPIEQLGNICGGGTPSRDIPSLWDGNIAWVTPAELTKLKGKLLCQTNECITEKGLATSAAKLLPVGSLLVTTRATIGSVAIAAIPVSTNQGFKSIILNDLSDSIFYYYVLQILAPEMSRLASGSTFLEISRRDFASILVPRPRIDEQQHIAEIVDTVDSAIRQTDMLIVKLKQIKAGLMEDLLTRGLNEEGRLRNPLTHPEQFKYSQLGGIPKDWKILTINECLQMGLISEVQDGNHGELHPKANDFVLDGIPFVMANNLVNGQIDLLSCAKITRQQYKALRVGFAFPGDVLLSHKGTIGLTAIVSSDLEQIMLTPQVTYYRIPKDGELLSRFLLWFFRSSLFQRKLQVLSDQTTRSYIGITQQKRLHILLPKLDEQKAIIGILDAQEERIHTEETNREKLKAVKQGLMQDLLTGRVRVSAFTVQNATEP